MYNQKALNPIHIRFSGFPTMGHFTTTLGMVFLVKMKMSDISALFVPALFPFQHKHRMADRGILKLLK